MSGNSPFSSYNLDKNISAAFFFSFPPCICVSNVLHINGNTGFLILTPASYKSCGWQLNGQSEDPVWRGCGFRMPRDVGHCQCTAFLTSFAPMMHLDDGALMWHSFKTEVKRCKVCFPHKWFLICNFHDSWHLPSNEYIFLFYPQEKGRLLLSPLPALISSFHHIYSWFPEVQKRVLRSRPLWVFFIRNAAMKTAPRISKPCPSCHTCSHHAVQIYWAPSQKQGSILPFSISTEKAVPKPHRSNG